MRKQKKPNINTNTDGEKYFLSLMIRQVYTSQAGLFQMFFFYLIAPCLSMHLNVQMKSSKFSYGAFWISLN